MQFSQSDTFWLIEVGRRILEQQAVPATDPYSFTTQAHWTVYQWLSEVIFAAANAMAGLTGVAVVGAAVLAMLFCVLIFRRLLSGGANVFTSALVIFLAVYSVYPDIAALRPQLFSYVLFWLLMTMCADATSSLGMKKAVILTFIIGVVWANCHLSFPVGLAVLLIQLICSAGLCIFKRADKDRMILFGAMLMAFALGTLCTPQGISLWSFIGSVHNMFASQEVEPLNWANKPLLGLMAASAFGAVICLRRKIDLSNALVLFALFVAGCAFARLVVFFCIASCPLISEGATQILGSRLSSGALKQFDERMKAAAGTPVYSFLVLLLSLVVVLVQPIYIPRTIPLQASEFISKHPIKGNLFCTAHAGSYLIYRFRGAIPVFIDTRLDLYDRDFCLRFIAALTQGTDWEALFSRYRIAAALLPNDSALQSLLENQAQWERIYRDDDFSLYIRRKSSGTR